MYDTQNAINAIYDAEAVLMNRIDKENLDEVLAKLAKAHSIIKEIEEELKKL